MTTHFLARTAERIARWPKAIRIRELQGSIHPDPGKALLLFASPRGGSTWLEEMLATIPRTATIWEPLDQVRNPAFRKVGFWWRQHIPEDADWPEAEACFEDLFSGSMLSPFLLESTTIDKLRDAERLIVKFIRGGMLLPWITRHFDLPKPVLLVRHPCAVVVSMRKHGAWTKFKHRLPKPPPHRYDEKVREMYERLGKVSGEVENLAAIWCLNNTHPLNHPGNDRDWTTITYEELVLRTEDTLRKVFTAWEMEVPAAALEMARRPSRTTRAGSPVTDPMGQLSSWRKHLSSEEQDRILAVVQRSGTDLYGSDILPLRNFTP